MKALIHSFAGALLLSGCASVAVKAPVRAANPVSVAVAGRPVVFRASCPEHFLVDPGEMADFAAEFPGQSVDDSEFQSFVREGFSSGIASAARSGRLSLEQKPCDTTAKPSPVGFSGEGTRLFLDTAGLDTGKVYLARSPIVFVLADSLTRVKFFEQVLPKAVKLIDAEMSYGLFDPRTKQMIETGVVKGLSSTGAASEADVVRDDWFSAAKRLAGELEKRLDSLLVLDSTFHR